MTIPDLSKALVDHLFLNGGVDVARAYNVGCEVKDLTQPRITVVSSALAFQPLARSGLTRKVVSYDVAYRVQCSDQLDAIDQHVNAVGELADAMPIGTVIGSGIITSVGVNPIYSPEHLVEKSVFTSVIRVEISL